MFLAFFEGPASDSFVILSFLLVGLPIAPFCGLTLRLASESLEASMLQKVAPRSRITEGERTGGLG